MPMIPIQLARLCGSQAFCKSTYTLNHEIRRLKAKGRVHEGLEPGRPIRDRKLSADAPERGKAECHHKERQPGCRGEQYRRDHLDQRFGFNFVERQG